MRRPRTEQETRDALHEQILALRSSAKAFDAGELWEAKRLATAVYNMVSDSGKTVSILTQLGQLERVRLISCVPEPDVEGRQTLRMLNGMLAISQTPDGPRYVAPLSGALSQRTLRFRPWWEETIYKNTRGQAISRKNLVSALRSKDGGSHFDRSLPDNAYLTLRDGSHSPLLVIEGEARQFRLQDSIQIPGGHLSIMRQVAWEMDESVGAFDQP